MFAQCYSNTHSTFDNDSWKSCLKSSNELTNGEDKHWMLFDFGQTYDIDSFYLWNYNVWGETEIGVKRITINYSSDNMNWQSAGSFNIDKAPGSWKYNDPVGMQSRMCVARYVMVLVDETWNNNDECAGIGELKFTLDICSSSEEVSDLNSLDVYPNPVSNTLYINIPKGLDTEQLFLYSSMGERIRTIAISSIQSSKINVSDLKPGIYYIKGGQEQVSVTSFVKIE